MNAITLTRDEAVAVAVGLTLTVGEFGISAYDVETSEQCHAVARRLEREATVRDGGDWWICHGIDATSPYAVDWLAREGRGGCPERFTMTAAGAAALAELLPDMLAEAAEDLAGDLAERAAHDDAVEDLEALAEQFGAGVSIARKRALDGLAARLGVELAAQVA